MNNYSYKSVSDFGSNEYSPINNPLTYCIGNNMDQRFLHGGNADAYGNSSRQCQLFMSDYCASGWDDFCEIESKNTNRSYPSHIQGCIDIGESCGGTAGESLIANTASRKYLLKMHNAHENYEPFDPTVANSPMIRYWVNDCGRYGVPEYAVDPEKIDQDVVMDKILEVTKQFQLFLAEKMRAAEAPDERVAECCALLTPSKMRELIPTFLEGVYEYMAANRRLVQNAWRGCRSSDKAHSLADVYDPDVVAEAGRLQLAGKLFFAGRVKSREGPVALPPPEEIEPEEEDDNASWVTDTSCDSDSDKVDSDSDGGSSGSGGASEPSGGRTCAALVPRPAGKRQTTLSSRLAGLGL